MNPLFNQLSRFYAKLEQQQTIDSYWKKLAQIYVKRHTLDSDSQTAAHHHDPEVKKLLYEAVTLNKQVEFDEDELSIFQHCQAFYNQTISY